MALMQIDNAVCEIRRRTKQVAYNKFISWIEHNNWN